MSRFVLRPGTAARADAIRHMIGSGVHHDNLVVAGIPRGAIERALGRRARLRLAAKAVRP